MNIAQTILAQIKAIDGFAMGAWGAKEIVRMDDGVKFKTSGMTPFKGYVYVKYDVGRDLYEVHFYKVRKSEMKNYKIVNYVYAEDLVDVIDRFVG